VVYRRAAVGLGLFALCAGALTLGRLLRQADLDANPSVWSGALMISALLSFTIAANVVVRFRGTGSRVPLLLGLTLAVTGILHLSGIFELYRHLPAGAEIHRVPLSWMAAQLLLGMVFFSATVLGDRLPWPRDPSRSVFAVLAVVLALLGVIAAALLILPNEPPIYPGRLVPRPWDLLPALIFLGAVVVLRRNTGGEGFAFDAVLVWVAGLNCTSHLIASQSGNLLDAPAATAQLTSTLGYVVLLGATLLDNARMFGQVRTLAMSDSVTGLANYRHLVNTLETELERTGRTGRPFAVLLLDLDGLKRINDKYGHLTGTRALCRVAHVLRLHCRAIDTAARYGGDEFALVLPETRLRNAQSVAERISTRLADDPETPRLSVSVGIATFPESGTSVHDLLEAADRALYENKARGKRMRAGRSKK